MQAIEITGLGTHVILPLTQLCDVEQAALTPPPSISNIKSNYKLFWEG